MTGVTHCLPLPPSPILALSYSTSCFAPQSTERPCNRFICRAAIGAWSVGSWSVCTPTASTVPSCASTPGIQTRVVQCVSSSGALMQDSACLGMISSVSKPSASAPCSSESSCVCSTDSDCGGSQWSCDLVSHKCACSSGWGGDDCTILLLLPPNGAPDCSDGVVDLHGTCCQGYIDISSGLCCPDSSDVDVSGRCCVNGRVDACGVCNGTGVAVDVWGVCCSTPLPPSGMCCVGAKVDSCGVCGGSNACRYVTVCVAFSLLPASRYCKCSIFSGRVYKGICSCHYFMCRLELL
jgi:hypothetical protein